ncbi:MAG: hypothetical protein HYU73_10170 [Betaproteobacteria bacterium]|nr:hypothetical protein [Betaproteobacteria bacterium]
MQIAPNFEAAKWKALELDDAASRDWNVAISVLQSRIRERYIVPADFLIAAEKKVPAIKRRFGFAVLALDCLLVETLGAFLEGLEKTKDQSKKIFCKFLTSRPQFSKDFPQLLAEQFYDEFRCGVLHQAEIGGNSKVWSVGPLVQKAGNSLIVNRNEFHERLKSEFEAYLQELRDPANMRLRSHFRKKMNFIARIHEN